MAAAARPQCSRPAPVTKGTDVSYDNLTIERGDHIATITMNRPEALNALDRGLTRDMHMAIEELSGEFPDIRVVILTGAGRGFCSGADVMAQARGLTPSEPEPHDPLNSIPPLAPELQAMPQPVIAAVNGVAAGAGFSLAMASDIRVAAESSRYAVIFVKRSLVPDTGSSHSLPAVVGRVARRWRWRSPAASTTRRGRSSAGLVNYVVPDDQVLPEARALASEIANNPPLCVQSIKQLMHRTDRLAEVLPYEHDANTPSMNTHDRREAVMSFVEKRDPVFLGR